MLFFLVLLWSLLLFEVKPPYLGWIITGVSHWFLCFPPCQFSYYIFNTFTKLYISPPLITSPVVSYQSKRQRSGNGLQGPIRSDLWLTFSLPILHSHQHVKLASVPWSLHLFLLPVVLFSQILARLALSLSLGPCSNITSSESLSLTILFNWPSTLLITLTLLYFSFWCLLDTQKSLIHFQCTLLKGMHYGLNYFFRCYLLDPIPFTQ